MRRLLLFVSVVVVVPLLMLSAATSPAEAQSPNIKIDICFDGRTSGTWVMPDGYAGGTMSGTLYTVRPFRGATLYNLDARLSGTPSSGRIVGTLIDVRGRTVAHVRGSYRPSYEGRSLTWKATIYPVQNLSRFADRRSYVFPGRMSGEVNMLTLNRATTFSGRFRICL